MRPPRTRLGLWLVGAWLVFGRPALALADSHHWSGRLGRLDVSSQVLGFQEGAGVGGWTAEDARQFLAWARPLSDALPPGVALQIEARDADLVLVVKRCSRGAPTCSRPLKRTLRASIAAPWIGPTMPEELVALIEKALGIRLPAPALAPGPIYTIQVLATPDRQLATERAARLNDTMPALPASMYTSTCAPCMSHEAQIVAEAGPWGDHHLVILGNFAAASDAARALAVLQAAGVPDGFVRELPR
ncbi:hypothetical protein [Nannocystis pusilla]|uniref:SPOR domain-containing protein n=1 Tax=Nannocystis pusilla TaxID=889268 RepID=A0ABS7TRC0_9BACT|nr:hypothetical protein [Nannocystis pusilla]MBZ5710779.1 hypothetical protein [Nannocystis pusilla]